MKAKFSFIAVLVLFIFSSCTPDPVDMAGSQDSQAGDVRISAK